MYLTLPGGLWLEMADTGANRRGVMILLRGLRTALETALLQGEASPSALARLWESPTGWLLLAFLLYYHGLSLAVVGRFFGVHKSTVRL